MKFEDSFLNNIDHQFKPKNLMEDDRARQRFLEKKRDVVDKYRPDITSFEDIVPGGASEIKFDLLDLESTKQKIEESNKNISPEQKALNEVAEIYEGVLVDQIEANAWFGEHCEMILTSEYDDIKNGIDGVGVFKGGEEKEYLGFGIDVTFASNTQVLEKKLNSIKSVIRNNTTPFVKYFEDEEGNKQTSFAVPKVIVGSRYASAESLIRLWGSSIEGRNKQLQEHPVQSKLIMETLSQLYYFHEFSKQVNNEEAALAYGKLYNKFVEIFEEKKEVIEGHWPVVLDDIVYQTIAEFTDMEKKAS
ncbi:MAG: hypothetical protein MRY57_02960 [Candidatus Pacebacteria bacterium]|nr:hypothetical protein [Candidatus Paceibacterota bacterium]